MSVWSLVGNWEVVSSNSTDGGRAWEAMAGPTVDLDNLCVVEVGGEKNSYFMLYYYIFFNNIILIKFRYRKKIKSRYRKDVARKTF